MPLQLQFTDKFGHVSPTAYLRIDSASWIRNSGGLQVTAHIFLDKACADDGTSQPVHELTQFVPFDTSSLTGGIELFLAALPAIAPGSPTQVA
jgi:hypothetical protein